MIKARFPPGSPVRNLAFLIDLYLELITYQAVV